MSPRSYLFVPADRPERYGKALQAGADAVIVDLEDAVAPARKAAARDAMANDLPAETVRPVFVRINAAGSPWFDDDLRLCAERPVQGVVAPKAEASEVLEHIAARVPRAAVLPLIETAAGLDAAQSTELKRGPLELSLVSS